MRHTCKALRNAPLKAPGSYRRPTLTSCNSLARCPKRCHQQQRQYFLMPLLRGAHDSLMGIIEIGGWITGRQPLPLPQRGPSSRTETLESRKIASDSSRSFQSSTKAESWKVSSPKPPTANPDAETSLPEQLRSVFRLFTNPVVVCTATHNGTPRAMTMSSFTSLTLSPTPLVSFNIATPSRTLDAIAFSQEFNIHVLAGDETGAAVADHFTKGNMDGVFDNIEAASYSMATPNSPPVIRGEGVLRVVRCKLLHDVTAQGLVPVRDHVIVVGEVVEMLPGSANKEFALAYADRKYRQVGGVIENSR